MSRYQLDIQLYINNLHAMTSYYNKIINKYYEQILELIIRFDPDKISYRYIFEAGFS